MQLCAVIGTQRTAGGSRSASLEGYAGTQPGRSQASSATTFAPVQSGTAEPQAHAGAVPQASLRQGELAGDAQPMKTGRLQSAQGPGAHSEQHASSKTGTQRTARHAAGGSPPHTSVLASGGGRPASAAMQSQHPAFRPAPDNHARPRWVPNGCSRRSPARGAKHTPTLSQPILPRERWGFPARSSPLGDRTAHSRRPVRGRGPMRGTTGGQAEHPDDQGVQYHVAPARHLLLGRSRAQEAKRAKQ